MKVPSHKRPYKIPRFLRDYGVPTIVNALLKADPLTEAEEITGESYKTSKATMALGFLKMQELHRDKDALLGSNKDTVLSMKTEEWEALIKKMGFNELLTIPFESGKQKEKLVICWLEPGILLCYDTCGLVYRNASSIYYCWKPDEDTEKTGKTYEVISSGTWTEDGVILGSHDAREALRFKLYKLFTYGTLITPWPKKPFLWLLHHGDTKDKNYDYEAINAERLAMLPKKVVDVIFNGPREH